MTFKGARTARFASITARAHRAGTFLLLLGASVASTHAACTSFGESPASPDAAVVAPVDASMPPTEDATVVQVPPNLTLPASAEIRRGDSLKVDFAVAAPPDVPLVGDIVAGPKPIVTGITVRNVVFDAKTGKGSFEIVTAPTTKTAPANLEVSLQGPRSSNRANLKLDVLGRPGELDESFGTGGTVIEVSPPRGMDVGSATVDTNGALYLTGQNNGVPTIRKYTAAGIVDTTFGKSGEVTLDGYNGRLTGIHARPDGKLAIGVNGTTPKGFNGYTRGTVSGNGGFDPRTFDTNIDCSILGAFRATVFTLHVCSSATSWYVFTPDFAGSVSAPNWGSPSQGYASGDDMTIQDYIEGPNFGFALGMGPIAGTFVAVRLTRNGLIDTAFGTNGRVVIQVPTEVYAFRYYGAAFDDAGNVYVAGSTQSLDGEIVVFRFSSTTGVLDATYGFARITKTPDISIKTELSPRAFVRTSDGFYVMGTATGISGWTFLLSRLDLAGNIDRGFGTAGALRLRVAPPTSNHQLGAALYDTPPHKLTLVGYHRNNASSDTRGISLARVWR